MALIIAELSMIILAVLALKVLFSESRGSLRCKKDLFYAVGITGGICLIFALFGRSMFGFSAVGDVQYPQLLQDSLRADRASLLVSSAWRSLVFVLLAGILLWLHMKKSVKDMVAVGLLAGLVFADMWTIDRKYVGEQNFLIDLLVFFQNHLQQSTSDTLPLICRQNQQILNIHDGSAISNHSHKPDKPVLLICCRYKQGIFKSSAEHIGPLGIIRPAYGLIKR